MKYSLLLSLLGLFFIQQPAHGQTVRFTDPTNVWHIHYSYQEPTFQTENEGFYFYVDTVVLNGYSYQRLTENRYSLDPFPTWVDSVLIREDTMSRRVYARIYKNGGYTHDTSEIVLYDFSLQQGDTFIMNSPSGTHKHVVNSISTILINGIAHKQWQMQAISPNIWDYDVIEGIGCVGEPLQPYRPTIVFSASWGLACFRNSDVGVWSSASWTDCLLGIENPKDNAKQITIFPNPAQDHVTIELRNKMFSQRPTISVFDCLGRKIHQVSAEPPQRSITLNTSRWSPGVYNVRIRNANGPSYSERVMINDD